MPDRTRLGPGPHDTTTPAWLPTLKDRFAEVLGTLPIGDRVDIPSVAERLVREVTGEKAS